MGFCANYQNISRGWKRPLLNFVGYCDLASFKKVNPENKKSWPENTRQPKSARAFLLSRPMENEKFSFSIGVDNRKALLDNRKALALFGCPVFSGHNFICYF